MAQVLIRDVPDAIVDGWKFKARLRGLSLQQVLRELIVTECAFTPEERSAFVADLLSRSSPSEALSLAEIRDGLT